MDTYTCVVKSEPKEGQLKVEVLMDLWRGGVYIPLVVSNILITTLVVEPVHEVRSDLLESLRCDNIGLAIVLIGGGREDTTVDVRCKK